MLNDDEYKEWATQNNLTEFATKYIDVNIRKAEPARLVKGHTNFTGKYPSRKMGVTIQWESRDVEGPAIHIMENDSGVLEYYDQPNILKFNFIKPDGRKSGYNATPDFFVIRKNEAGWEEWKNEKSLLEISKSKPWLYIKDPDGNWRSPPGENAAAEYGLTYKVCCADKEISPILHSNFIFLDSYLRNNERLEIKENVLEDIKSIISKGKVIKLNELIFELNEKLIKADNVYISIIKGEIYVDLNVYRLSEPERVPIFLTKDLAEIYTNIIKSDKDKHKEMKSRIKLRAGQNLIWDGVVWEIKNVGRNFISLSSNGEIADLTLDQIWKLIDTGKIVGVEIDEEDQSSLTLEPILLANEADLIVAKERQIFVKAYMNKKFIQQEGGPVDRTVRRWVKRYREAEQLYGYGLIGLLPNEKGKGNRELKMNPKIKELMREFIKKEYLNTTQKNRVIVYGEFSNYCEELGYNPPSFTTFCKEIKKIPRKETKEKREGKRAAYQEIEVPLHLHYGTPRHGQFPFNICHLDHTKLDIELVSSRTGKVLGRPYLTLMMDAFCRRVLAFHLSYSPPSHRSCMMVLRDCVRRYNRFPQSLVVDNGAEFHSVYFETVLAMYECEPRWRRPAHPRDGSVLERLFGSTNTRVIHNIQGNTKIMKNVRQVTKSVNPKNLASLTLIELNEALEYFFFEIYDTIEHPSLENNRSPRELFESGFLFGEREHTYVHYDRLFKILTLPSPKLIDSLVRPGKGIKLNYSYYWSNALLDRDIENTRVDVRYDPYDLSVAYAYVKNQWVECKHQYYREFEHLTIKELKFITEELRKTAQNTNKNFTINAKKIAQAIGSFENKKEFQMIKSKVEDELEIVKSKELDDVDENTTVNIVDEQRNVRIILEEENDKKQKEQKKETPVQNKIALYEEDQEDEEEWNDDDEFYEEDNTDEYF